MPNWNFWIDVGGTFTDCIGRDPNGQLRLHKLLSTGVYLGTVGTESTRDCLVDPAQCHAPDGYFAGYELTLRNGFPGSAILDQGVTISRFSAAQGALELSRPLAVPPRPGMRYELTSPEPAPVAGIRWLLGKSLGDPLGQMRVQLGTTLGINALLERHGPPTAFVTTKGFGDLLRIGYQDRPWLFELDIRRSSPFYRNVLEIDERLDPQGRVIQPLRLELARPELEKLKADGIESLAIGLLHSYRNPDHELALERLALELGFQQISLSSRLSPTQRIVMRAETAVVDAFLKPVLRRYIDRLEQCLQGAELWLMTSAGNLVSPKNFEAKDLILSGPAGGVRGCATAATTAGFGKVIGFDMGGTSTDVSRFDGQFEYDFEMELRDPGTGTPTRVLAPRLAMETVAAGGGSICWFDGQKPRVGPQSAGASPGPASYGKGGPLCVTDLNLFLGRLPGEYFPFPLNLASVEARLDEMIAAIAGATGQAYTREALAEGLIAIADANIVAEIKKISVAKGYDARAHALLPFGGAGGLHACQVARELGMSTIVFHRHAGVLSAYGIGHSRSGFFSERSVGKPYCTETQAEIESLSDEMERELRQRALTDATSRPLHRRNYLDLRYRGQDHSLTVERPQNGDYLEAFRGRYEQIYGFLHETREIEVVVIRVELAEDFSTDRASETAARAYTPAPLRTSPVHFHGRSYDAPVFAGSELRSGARLQGPAIVLEPTSTLFIEPGWRGYRKTSDHLVLTRETAAETNSSLDSRPQVDAVTLELFHNRFASIASRMGTALRRTALSPNIKERLDFSCAVFTAQGNLVANAPHIPVHLGAMNQCVKCLLEEPGKIQPGEVIVTNDPFRGGSHLPDVTVVTPVFSLDSVPRLLFFTASRAHHAEIGGITPGSMPPFSKNLAEEGVLLRALRLKAGEPASEQILRVALTDGQYPSRAPDDNIADIRAQIAANQVGAEELRELVSREGERRVTEYMGHIQRSTGQKMRAALRRLRPGRYRFEDALDDGSPIAVAVEIEPEGRAEIDFTGSGPTVSSNLNANRAIVGSAVMYCLRCLIDEPIPLNAGVLDPVEIRVPQGSLLDPKVGEDAAHTPAVGGGNVETSQRLVDVIFGALGTVAASQGTMNNFLFGKSGAGAFGYYETIGGGTGAGPGFHGADGVHSHMTNTRITDPEVLESRYPVRLRRFAIRPDSGGQGLFHGGQGLIREWEFLAPLEVSIVSSRRTRAPFGLNGGAPGRMGRNLIFRSGNHVAEELPSSAQLSVRPGDRICLETPGGGGFGKD